MAGRDLSLLMPVFNERATVEIAIERVLGAEVPVERLELVVVDDGSGDGTTELLAGQSWPDNVKLVRHDRNRGKGAAVRTALAHATGEFCIVMGADLEYDPESFGALLAPLLAGDAEAVYGVRGFEAHSAYSFWYVVGNKSVTLAANLLYNVWLKDLMTCQKMLRTDLFRRLPLRANGFVIEREITARLLRAGARIYEVPITYRARRREEGKKLTAADGLRVLATLARCRVR
ncbi:MAG TPA: glycosyltransferase family 2 protein [Gaiellaceae bacterium]|nr:glycosyltransferase family 2 protein [Gaiellaceae bacterium]